MAVYEVQTKIYRGGRNGVLHDALSVRYDDYELATQNLTQTVDMIVAAGGEVLEVWFESQVYIYNNKTYVQTLKTIS